VYIAVNCDIKDIKNDEVEMISNPETKRNGTNKKERPGDALFSFSS